jgi:hypothetical protein
MKEKTYQPASGFTKTNTELHTWAGKLVSKIKNKFKEIEITAHVATYREQGREHLSCDLINVEHNISMPITICAEGDYYLPLDTDMSEADVHDMTEATHLAGLITQAVNAKVILGRLVNEINPEVLANPLRENQTNDHINIWK